MMLFAALAAAACPPALAEYEAKGKRDPFVPLILSDGRRINPPGVEEGGKPGAIGSLALEGIVYDPAGESYVILNGHVLKKGQERDGIKILEIGANGATLWKDGETHRLTIQKPGKETEAE